jgi:hypothetical protein
LILPDRYFVHPDNLFLNNLIPKTDGGGFLTFSTTVGIFSYRQMALAHYCPMRAGGELKKYEL